MKPILIVDDDPIFSEVLAKALAKRDFEVRSATNVEHAKQLLKEFQPDYAVVDLRMPPGPSGLELIPSLCELNKEIKIVILTGYASISTAVEAVKLGATHYLTKPADADEIVAAFERSSGESQTEIPPTPISLDRLEWEHIQKVLADCNGNISEAARCLGLHRRTLQRKLQKRPVRSP